MKENLSDDDLVLPVDFSENFVCKYHREIQACHFGANKLQLCLHTGIIYKGEEKLPFCTISQDLHHDAVAIWSHLVPVMSQYKSVTTLHFISDSPSSQYQNKGMFFIMISRIIPFFPELKRFTWNYT
jgi:hypothetical protein